MKKYGVIFEDIKKPNAPLVRLIHTPTHGAFFGSAFRLTDSDFFGQVLLYINQHYEAVATRDGIGIYLVVGFTARQYGLDPISQQVARVDRDEKYQIFIKRSKASTTLDIGKIILETKAKIGITNGGGRAEVGGINTSSKASAIKAMRLITDMIRTSCP